MDPISVSQVLTLVLAVLGFVLTGVISYAVTLLKKVLANNEDTNLKINTLSINTEQIKKDITTLTVAKEEDKKDISSLKMLYIELDYKIKHILDKLKSNEYKGL
jgi:hypothetical protein